MKPFLLSLALAGTVALPIAAGAQQNPPNPPTQAERAQMRADFQQMREAHQQFRAQVLGALTAEHRRLLASIAGNLAIADHPDYRAAAAQLDDALSPGEKNAIMAADRQMRAQAKAMMANMPKPQWEQREGANGAARARRTGERRRRTAGGILLAVASGRGMMPMMGRRWAGGPPPQR